MRDLLTVDALDRMADDYAHRALGEVDPARQRDWQLCCAIARGEADRRRRRNPVTFETTGDGG